MQAIGTEQVLETYVELSVPIRFWEFKMPDTDHYTHEQFNSRLRELIIESSKESNKSSPEARARTGEWLQANGEPFKILAEYIEGIVYSWFEENTQIKLQLNSTCWGSSYKQGDYGRNHAHTPASWAWVYYVSVSEDTTPLVFTHAPGYTYKPKSGYGIMFPGWLEHEVPEHKSSAERLIVVGNIDAVGSVPYGGTGNVIYNNNY